jgi:hypothetical protein
MEDELAEPGEVATPVTQEDEEHKMIEPHAPHESVHTWKDAIIHIGIIAVGLLLAIGLEQTVEFFHHRHQVTETREALRIERENNIQRFAMQTQEFYRYVPKLKTNLAIYQYLRAHPGAPKEQWPGEFSWIGMIFGHVDSVWQIAQQSNVLQYMPPGEVRRTAGTYKLLQGLTDEAVEIRKTKYEIYLSYVEQPDASKLTPVQLDEQIRLTSELLLEYSKIANTQIVISMLNPDFKPSPTNADRDDLMHMSPPPADAKIVHEAVMRIHNLDQAEEENRPVDAGRPEEMKEWSKQPK